MTLLSALIATRKRRLRPEGYSQAAGALASFLIMALAIRLGANVFLAHQLSSSAGIDPIHASFFTQFNTAWCALFLATIAPIIAYRGIHRTAKNRRMNYLPITRKQMLLAVILASLRGVPVYAPVALSAVAYLAAGSATAHGSMLPPLVFLFTGLIGLLLILFIAWRRNIREDHLEFIELGLMATLILANPDFRIDAGEPSLLLFGHFSMAAQLSWLLFVIPLFGAAAVAGALLVSSLISEVRAGRRPGHRHPVLALYGSRIPVGLFLAGYTIEIPIILTNPALFTTVRTIVLFLLGLRVLWYLSFVFHTEQAVARIIRAPSRFSDRLLVYRHTASVHALLCVVPIIVYIVRIIVG